MSETLVDNQDNPNLGWEEEDHEATFADTVPNQQGGSLRLVGRMFGERDVNKRAMIGMINGIWSNFCEPTVQDIQKTANTFVFIFNRKEEMDRAWEGRPWQVSGNTLQLKKWEDSIRPLNINFDLADYWIQVHGIPDHKRTASNIESAVAMFPKIHGIDLRGLNPDRYMEFVRVFVQVDHTRPLPPGSYCTTDGVREWLGFRYEKLYLLCYYCGRQGHVKQDCRKRREDLEGGIAAAPEGRFTPWMKAGTRAQRPPPPPRGRIIHLSPGDAGSSSGSPGFVQNQIWVPGMASPMIGSVNLGSPASPLEGSWGLGVRGPPGFTPHPFPTDRLSHSPRPTSEASAQRLQSPSPDQNLVVYGSTPGFSPTFSYSANPPPLVRNLATEMEAAGLWNKSPLHHSFYQSGPFQAQGGKYEVPISQIHSHHPANMAQLNKQNVSQIVHDLSQKMDLNLRPSGYNYSHHSGQDEETQGDVKKRKHGQPLDFEGPYFSLGEGSIKPRNARIKVKGRKQQQLNLEKEVDQASYQENEGKGKLANSEAPVAGYKPPGDP
ncbi:unnamed protein product [Linum trigynum]|uniref:CCHC-type domain-containing protein n=1 Tax=Linum trigynum TaxID=586398 RepID=A0AAV2CN82_9ROSI